jgi:hypothetical protein
MHRFIADEDRLSGVEGVIQTMVSMSILMSQEASRQILMEMAMTTVIREVFSSQAARDVLATLRRIAQRQGRPLQSLRHSPI